MRVVYSPRAVRDLEQIGAYYRLRGDAVEILHIRHTALQPWDERTD